jgi:[ribulose-bisphosphate carboxylase]-lysine N-methyltransferase
MRFYFAAKILAVAYLVPAVVVSFQVGFLEIPTRTIHRQTAAATTTLYSSLESLSTNLENALDKCRSEVLKTCKVAVAPSTTGRLGLIAIKSISKGEVVLAMPYDDRLELSAATARNIVFKDVLVESYDGWTGDAGLVALMILNELARTTNQGIDLPKRSTVMQDVMGSWVAALPSPSEMKMHPLLWSEEDLEVLQSSSTNKIYRAMDDLEEDASWLSDNIFSKDRTKFPEFVTWNGEKIPCFSVDGYKWATALAQSRSVFVDGSLRLLPVLDMCNHDDEGSEVRGGSMGTFGATKVAELVSSKKYAVGDEVFCSYGPKSAADYLLEHGFCPPRCLKTAVSEVTFELDSGDRFYEDKMDILEFETYDQAPMNPSQSFDLISAPGRDGEPDPAMLQFVRLSKLGGTDAFLLEAIFRKEVWEFMGLPVSERNELQVVNAISEACQTALDDLKACPQGGPEICTQLRESETKALTRTLEYLQRDKQALDLKEYYQERRLKDLGLGSDWAPEDDMMGEDTGFGQTRVPGGADYDW